MWSAETLTYGGAFMKTLLRLRRTLLFRCWFVTGLFLVYAFDAGAAYGQEPPPSLDDQLVRQLGIGEQRGCIDFLGLPRGFLAAEDGSKVQAKLDELRNLGQI